MDQRQLARKTSNALERLDSVEKTIGNIVGAVNNSFTQISRQLSGITEVLDAVVQTLGAENIQKVMEESRRTKAEEAAKAQETALKALLDKGEVKAVEKVSEKSIIVGRDHLADGTLRHPGRVQLMFSEIEPPFRPSFLGQSIGFVLDLPTGGKFEVMELYEVVEKTEASVAQPAVP